MIQAVIIKNYLDDGSLFNTHFKQLVSSTRIIVNYATASIVFKNEDYRRIAQHGLDYLEQIHWQPESQTYAWTLNNHQPLDMTQQAYGYAFVLLAYSALFKAKIVKDKKALIRTYNLLEERFWQAEYGLYADEISPSGELSEYRGQNSNMHLCEAMLAAYDANKRRAVFRPCIRDCQQHRTTPSGPHRRSDLGTLHPKFPT